MSIGNDHSSSLEDQAWGQSLGEFLGKWLKEGQPDVELTITKSQQANQAVVSQTNLPLAPDGALSGIYESTPQAEVVVESSGKVVFSLVPGGREKNGYKILELVPAPSVDDPKEVERFVEDDGTDDEEWPVV